MKFNIRFRFRFCCALSVIWIQALLSFGHVSKLSNSCSAFHPIVGVNKMLHGVDITNFNIFDFSSNIRAPVFEISCDLNETWSREHIPNQNSYHLPDQVYHVFPDEEGIKNLYLPRFALAHDMFDVRNMFLNFHKLTTTTEKTGACSKNADYVALLKDHFGANKSFALITSTVGLYSIEFKPPNDIMLTDDFMNRIKMLSPAKYEQNVSSYRSFVHQFGTHYIERAHFGCFIYKLFRIPNEYLYTFGEVDIEDILKTSYYLWVQSESQAKWMNVSKPANYDKFCSKVDCNWKDTFDTVVYGYNNRCPNRPQSKHNQYLVKEAIETLYDKPALIEYNLRPLEDLIANKNVRAEVAIANERYRIDAYLGELRAVYKAAKNYYQPSEEDKVCLGKVKTFVNSNISTINANEAISIIEDLYSKVKDKPHVDQLITNYYVTASLKLQFADSICDRSAGLCPSSVIIDENNQLEQLFHEYESSKADGKYYPREIYNQFGKKAQVFNARYRIGVDLQRGLRASCENC